MARLPVPGSDDGTWGDILNEYLQQSHNADGTLKSAAIHSALPDASAGQKGVVRLAGDLGGTASSPTVPGLANKADISALTAHETASDPHADAGYAIFMNSGRRIFVGTEDSTDTSAAEDGDIWIVTAS